MKTSVPVFTKCDAFQCNTDGSNGNNPACQLQTTNVYFGGKLVTTNGDGVKGTVYAISAGGSGRTLTLTKGDGSITRYSYAGNTNTDPAGKWKAFAGDACGNLTLVFDRFGSGNHSRTSPSHLARRVEL